MTKSTQACRAIHSAKTESQVIGAVRGYLDSLEASDLEQLPAELLVLGLTPAEEVIRSALQMLNSRKKSAGKSKSGILREATLVFTTAARQLARLSRDGS